MTTAQFTPPQAALVAIDIAKNRHEVLIEPGRGMRRRRLTILNNRADYDRLIQILLGLGCPVIVAFDTPDLDAFQARLLTAGGSVVEAIKAVEFGPNRMRIGFFADVDGYLLEVIER